MAKFAVFFSLTGQTIANFIERPSDRLATVQAVVQPMGGNVDAYYFMFGQDDGVVIVDLADSKTAAALSLAVSSTGAFSKVHTHELIPASDLNSVLERAKSARASYRPPGA